MPSHTSTSSAKDPRAREVKQKNEDGYNFIYLLRYHLYLETDQTVPAFVVGQILDQTYYKPLNPPTP